MPPEFPTSFTVLDYCISPILLAIIFLIAIRIRNNNIGKYPYFKFFIPGLVVKCIGALAVGFVYLYYYRGGDTLNYYYSSRVMLELLKINPEVFFKIVVLGDLTPENSFVFTSATGYTYYYNDALSFFIVRLITPITLISFNSFLGASFFVTFISYSGIWKLYSVFVEEYPKLQKQLAYAVLFVPSVFFWGSGILKDPITISAAGWFTFGIYQIGIKRQYKIQNILFVLISSYIMLSIKPYILYVLLPSSSIWILISSLKQIKSPLVRSLTLPLLLFIFSFGTYLLLIQLGKDRAKFSFNNLFNLAKTTQFDLKREEYGGSSFDLGEFDESLNGMLSKAPEAINYALFRPYIWEARNPLMLFSAIENLVILFLTLYLLIRVNIFNTYKLIRKNSIIFFSLSYSILFAFSVGISTSNFGTLVRYKIPAIPFFVASLLIIIALHKEEREMKKTK